MKNSVIVLLALMCMSVPRAFAQKSETKAPADKRIELIEETVVTTTSYSNGTSKSSAAKHYYFKVGDGKQLGVGYGGKTLKPFVQSCPEAVKELNSCKKKANAATWCLLPTIAGPIIAIVGAVSVKDADGNLKPLNPITITGGVLFIGGYIAHVVFASQTTKHLRKSVDVYNQSLASGSLIRRMKPDEVSLCGNAGGMGLGLRWNLDK